VNGNASQSTNSLSAAGEMPCDDGHISLLFRAAQSVTSPKNMSYQTHTEFSALPKAISAQGKL